MRTGIVVAITTALLALAVPEAVLSQPQTVTIQDLEYRPRPLRIRVQGETVRVEVRWTNNGPSNHTVTADRGAFNSGQLARGATFSYTFTSTGTFDYHCENHSAMKGQIIVEAAARDGDGDGGDGGGGGY